MLLVGFLGLVAVAMSSSAAAADEASGGENAKQAAPILYRRIYVPADKLDAWPRDGEKYLPIESREFDAWIAATQGKSIAEGPAATIEEANYSARWDGGRLQSGTGNWTIARHQDNSDSAPVILPLGNSDLSISKARWRDAPQQQVRLGNWGRDGEQANSLGLEIPRSGVLDFDWVAPARAIQGGVEIPWRLPPATSTRLSLQLPEGMTPHVAGAVVVESSALPATDASQSGWRVWTLVLEPSQSTPLRIARVADAATADEPAITLAEKLRYRCSQRGLDIQATWSLVDASGEQRELLVPLPGGMVLMNATHDGRTLAWRSERVGDSTTRQARIQLPKVTAGAMMNLAIRAWYPMKTDSAVVLPQVRPDSVSWTSGEIEVNVDEPLEAEDVAYVGCVQSAAARFENGRATWPLVAFSDDARITLKLAQRKGETTMRVVSSLATTEADTTGRLVVECTVAAGSVHSLSGKLAAGWTVEAVESQPAEAINEWFVDSHDGHQTLELQLSKTISPHQPITFTITGRLQRQGVRSPIPVRTLRMIDWKNAHVSTHVLFFQTSDPYAPESVGNLPLALEETLGASRALFLSTTASSLYDLLAADADAGLRLAPKLGRYDAEIRSTLAYDRGQLMQTHRLLVKPTSDRVDRVLVFSTTPLGEGVAWSEAGTGAAVAAERITADDSRYGGYPPGGELWQIRLSRPITAAAEIIARNSLPLTSEFQAPLIALPDAIVQRGQVLVGGLGETQPRLIPKHLRAVPLPPPANTSTDAPLVAANSMAMPTPPGDVESAASIQASFRYEPVDCLVPARAPALVLGSPQDDGLKPLVARVLDLESYYTFDGRGDHRVTYRLENHGAASISLRVPDPGHTVVKSVWVDGRALEKPIINQAGHFSPIPLPQDSQTVTLSVYLESRHAPLRAGGRLKPPLLTEDLNVLGGNWTVYLPDDFSVAGADDQTGPTPWNWRERLFGPLGRSYESAPFNPLRAVNWFLSGSTIAPARPPQVTADPFTSAPTTVEASLPGWHVHRARFVGAAPPDIVVAHPRAISAWAIVAFIVGLLLGRPLRTARLNAFVPALAGTAILCLLLPEAFAPIATGAFLGLLLSLIAIWPQRRQTEDPSSRSWSRVSTVTYATSLLALVLATSRVTLAADQPSTTVELPQNAIHSVLIPVDSAGRPANSKVFISERFLRQLTATQEQRSADERWLLHDAHYGITLTEKADRTGLLPGKWILRFDLETLARDTTIVLPLNQSQADWRPTALLSGVPATLVWNHAGTSCSVQIREPGRYSLEFSCVPHVRQQAGESQVKIVIPPLLEAHAELDLPTVAEGPKLNGDPIVADGPESTATQRRNLLGADRLDVRWSEQSAAANRPSALKATVLRWLKLDADEIELQTKYLLDGQPNRDQDLMVVFDARWEPAWLAADEIKSKVDRLPNGKRSIRIPLNAADDPRNELTLSWRLVSGPVFGRLQLPSIELATIPIDQRWLAVSPAPTLECKVLSSGAAPGTTNEFATLWGDIEDGRSPDVVLQNINADSDLWLEVRPRQIAAQVDGILHVAVGGDKLALQYQANVIPGTQYTHRFALASPADLQIDQVTVSQAGKPIPVRWTRPEPQRVNVFFGQSLTSAYDIVVSGTVSRHQGEPNALPRLAAVSGGEAAERVQLYRNEEVLVELQGLPNDDAAASAWVATPLAWPALPLRACRLDRAAFDQVRLNVSPNELQLSGSTLVALARSEAGWTASWHGHLRVERGNLDSLKLHVPLTWVGPFTVESAIPASATTAVQHKRQAVVTVKFERSIESGTAVDVSLRGPLVAATASGVAVPGIVVEPLPLGQRFVRVPTKAEERTVAWTQQGVRPAELPAEFAAAKTARRLSTAPSQHFQSYEITAEPYRVAIEPAAPAQLQPTVRLAEAIAVAGPNGGLIIHSRLVVNPQGLAKCTIDIPKNQRLTSIRVEGQPLLTERTTRNHYDIQIGPGDLPRVVDVVTSLSATALEGRSVVERPLLLANGKPLPVEMSIWSVGSPINETSPRFEDRRVSAVDYMTLRLDRLVSIAEAAAPLAAEATPPDGFNWFQPWAKLLATVREEAIDAKARVQSPLVQVDPEADDPLLVSLDRFDEWLEQSQEAVAPASAEMPFTQIGAGQPSADIGLARDGVAKWHYCVSQGELDHIMVDLRPTESRSRFQRAAGVVAVLAVAAVLFWLTQQPAFVDVVRRWPHAVMFLVGVLYWAWLWPSWLGIIIAVASVILAARSGWQHRPLTLEGSTVLRAGPSP